MQQEKNLENKARQIRREVLNIALEEGEAHLGGSFSEIEILISLYDYALEKEDKFILSKGHACYPLYILLREKGFNPRIQTHPDLDEKNGIYATTGSLGHGLPMAVGMAIARKKLNKNGDIYVLISDGECQTGTTWESALIASKYKLDNLKVIVDYNKLQALDLISKVLPLENLKYKFEAFNWYVEEIDGHEFKEIIPALKKREKDKPYIIIANTIKGKGVSYMENNPQWHGKRVTSERVAKAYEELNGDLK